MSSVPTIKPSDGGLDFRAMVAEAAYYKAEHRGFAPGFEMDDWLAAERELGSISEPPAKPKRKTAARSTKKKKATTAARS